jgi:hypothetical protein
MRFKSSAFFVDEDRRLTQEALAALQPSRDAVMTVTATTLLVDVQAMAYFAGSLAVTLKRNGVSTAITTAMLLVNPGDVVALPSAQTVKMVPI